MGAMTPAEGTIDEKAVAAEAEKALEDIARIKAETAKAIFGQEAVVWCARGRTYAVVARGRPTDVEHVAEYVRLSAE